MSDFRKGNKIMKLELNRKQIDVVLGNKCMTIEQLAKLYGCSRSRMSVILNSRVVTPMCAGRLAKALNVKVEQITE